MTLREKIKGIDDSKKKILVIPEWDNEEIEVRSLSGAQRGQMFEVCVDDKGNFKRSGTFLYMVIHCSYDPKSGKLIFQEKDEEWLKDKNASALEKIAMCAMQMSGLSPEAVEEAKKK